MVPIRLMEPSKARTLPLPGVPGSVLCLPSQRASPRQAAGGPAACGGLCTLLQVGLVGFLREEDHGVRWRRCPVWLQCELAPAWGGVGHV